LPLSTETLLVIDQGMRRLLRDGAAPSSGASIPAIRTSCRRWKVSPSATLALDPNKRLIADLQTVM
jgi:hypothetical protein